MAVLDRWFWGIQICNALGLDPNITKSITLRVEAGEVLMADVVQYVNKERTEKITRILKACQWEEHTKSNDA